MDFFKLALLILTLVFSHLPAYGMNNCAALFAFDQPEYALPKGETLVHSIARGRSEINYVQLIANLLEAAQSKDALQKTWPGTSMAGQIWTLSSREAVWGAESPAHKTERPIVANFSIREGYRFFDPWNPQHVALWKSWRRNNTGKANKFSPQQIQNIKDDMISHNQWKKSTGNEPNLPYEIPSHSAFYETFKLVGIRYNYNPGTELRIFAWNIVDFRGVHAIHFQIPPDLLALLNARTNGSLQESVTVIPR
jgi:hypothetical protein